MKFNKKLFSLLMFVMLICCVSAASATDVDDIVGTEDADILEVDDAVDSVDVVDQDESNDVVDSVDDVEIEKNVSDDVDTKVKVATITDSDYDKYFDADGYLNDTTITGLTFNGNFNAKSFGNFKINRTIDLNVANATFNGVNFDLMSEGLILDGATFINEGRPINDAYTYISASNTIVQNTNIVVSAGYNADYFAISVYNANNVRILNNVINYTCNYANPSNYNYAIRVEGGRNVEVSGNNITAYLPLKDVDYNQIFPSIDTDLVAGVAVQSSYNFKFTNNRLLVNVSRNSTGYPTLDAFIIVDSQKAYIAHNTIIEIDNKTLAGNNNYLYAIDVYQCDNSIIDMNNITLESQGGTIIAGTNNGTGAAYGIQLTGGHTGIVISNNNITTSNNGPNCGIYSQNYPGYTSLNITGNRINVSGNAGLHAWSLVTGMELGDDDDYVARNIVYVINKAAYDSTHNAYGISYSQYAMRSPTFNITNNTVEVKNGTYAVYIMYGGSGSVTNNCLNTTAYCCNNAVNYNPNVIVSGNYCPLGSNCTCGCNCTSHNNNIPSKSILKLGNVRPVSAPEVLSARVCPIIDFLI